MIDANPVTRSNRLSLLIGMIAVITGVLAGFLVLTLGTPYTLIFAFAALFFAGAALVRIELGLMALVFLIYTNTFGVASYRTDLPLGLLMGAFVLGIVVLRSIFSGDRPFEWIRPMLFLSLYGFVAVVSLTYSKDLPATQKAIFVCMQSILFAFLVVLTLQNAKFLRNVIWTLLLAGLFMASISVYQYLTGSFGQTFGGFALAEIRHIAGSELGYRIAGPIGDANFYGQILIVLIPLALERTWREKNFLLRILAGTILLITTLAIVFTFSRGTFLALCVTSAFLLLAFKPSLKHIALAMILVFTLLPFVPQSYYERMSTIKELLPGNRGIHADSAFRGRASEWSAAWLMFTDHPLFGVGFGNYKNQYQRYSQQVGLDPRLSERSAHSLYLQIAAETGIFGLLVFGFVLFKALRGLKLAKSRFEEAGKLDAANLTSAFTVSLLGYLVAGIFLHTAYPNILWLLLGIAFALPGAARNEVFVKTTQNQPGLAA